MGSRCYVLFKARGHLTCGDGAMASAPRKTLPSCLSDRVDKGEPLPHLEIVDEGQQQDKGQGESCGGS